MKVRLCVGGGGGRCTQVTIKPSLVDSSDFQGGI